VTRRTVRASATDRREVGETDAQCRHSRAGAAGRQAVEPRDVVTGHTMKASATD
jgi:hypothetical protein